VQSADPRGQITLRTEQGTVRLQTQPLTQAQQAALQSGAPVRLEVRNAAVQPAVLRLLIPQSAAPPTAQSTAQATAQPAVSTGASAPAPTVPLAVGRIVTATVVPGDAVARAPAPAPAPGQTSAQPPGASATVPPPGAPPQGTASAPAGQPAAPGSGAPSSGVPGTTAGAGAASGAAQPGTGSGTPTSSGAPASGPSPAASGTGAPGAGPPPPTAPQNLLGQRAAAAYGRFSVTTAAGSAPTGAATTPAQVGPGQTQPGLTQPGLAQPGLTPPGLSQPGRAGVAGAPQAPGQNAPGQNIPSSGAHASGSQNPAGAGQAGAGQAVAGQATAGQGGRVLVNGAVLTVRVAAIGGEAARAPLAATGLVQDGGGQATVQRISGTIAGVTSAQRPILQTPVGFLALETRADAQLGTRVGLEVLASGTRAANERPAPLSVLAREWPALDETLRVLEQAGGAANAAQAAQNAVARPGPQLTAALLFLMTALRGGDPRALIRSEGMRMLESAGRGGLLGTLTEDVQTLSRATEPSDTGWRAFLIPFGEDESRRQVRFLVRDRDRGNPDGEHKDDGTQFMVDLDLTRIGPFRLDGVARSNLLDLMVRTETALPGQVRRDIQALFDNTLDRTGIVGHLRFRASPVMPPLPIKELAAGVAGDNTTVTV